MAFSKELEEIINATLADGVITEKERTVLHKKAQQLGVDPDEVDVVIEGRLQQMQNEIDKAKQKVRKCPSCGEIIPAMTAVCPNCGQVIDTSNPDNKALAVFMDQLEKKLVQLKERGASNFNNKARAELESMIRQGKALYGNNKKINFLISEVEASIAKFENAHKRKSIIKIIIVILILMIPVGFYVKCTHDSEVEEQNRQAEYNNYKLQIDNQFNGILNSIKSLPSPNKKNFDVCADQVRTIHWNEIDCGDNTDADIYHTTKQREAEKMVNDYIDILQAIELEYIDKRTGKQTAESSYIIDYPDGSCGTGYNEPNPKYVKKIHW